MQRQRPLAASCLAWSFGLAALLCAAAGCEGALAIPGTLAYSVVYSETKPAPDERTADAPWIRPAVRAPVFEHWRFDVVRGPYIADRWWRTSDGENVTYESLRKRALRYAKAHEVATDPETLAGLTVISLEPRIVIMCRLESTANRWLRVSTRTEEGDPLAWFDLDDPEPPRALQFDDAGAATIPTPWGELRLARTVSGVEVHAAAKAPNRPTP